MTDEEIKLEATKIAMKESCHRCDKVLCDNPSKYCKWFNGCYKLAKENVELKAQIEKMKCCENCAKQLKNVVCVRCKNNSEWELAE